MKLDLTVDYEERSPNKQRLHGLPDVVEEEDDVFEWIFKFMEQLNQLTLP